MSDDAKRIAEVIDIRMAGAQLHEVRAYAAENEWNATDEQIQGYIDAANEAIAGIERQQDIINRHIAQRRAIYANAVKGGDWRAALAALRDEAAMLGLYNSAEPTETTEENERLIHERAARLAGERWRDATPRLNVIDAK